MTYLQTAFKPLSEKEIIDIEEHHKVNGLVYARKDYAYKVRAISICDHYKYEWDEMIEFFGFVCCSCESEVIGGRPTKDHIYPTALGGTNSIRNLQPLCRECNASKKRNIIDYRLSYCNSHNKNLPEKWLLNL